MKHSLANYPTQFLGCVVSPNKICMQFSDVQSKLRFKQGAHYIKLPDTSKALPITPTGTDVDLLAVGCVMPVLEQTQLNLIQAYLEYGIKHSDSYRDKYSSEFLGFLIRVHKELEDVISALS